MGDDSPSSRIHAGVRATLSARKARPEPAADVPTEVIAIGTRGLFAIHRHAETERLRAVFNVIETPRSVPVHLLDLRPHLHLTDPLSGATSVPACDRLWLRPARDGSGLSPGYCR